MSSDRGGNCESLVVDLSSVTDQRDYSRRHHLDATTRGHLIGEGASVFSLMKPEDQARIRSLAAVEDGNGDNRRKRNRWDQPSSTGVSKDHQGCDVACNAV